MLREQLTELVTSYQQAGFSNFRDIIVKMKDSSELKEELITLKYSQDTSTSQVLSDLTSAKYEKLLKLQDIFEEIIP